VSKRNVLTALINHLLGVGVDLIGKLSLFLSVSFFREHCDGGYEHH
jgi:hypothetical protein